MAGTPPLDRSSSPRRRSSTDWHLDALSRRSKVYFAGYNERDRPVVVEYREGQLKTIVRYWVTGGDGQPLASEWFDEDGEPIPVPTNPLTRREVVHPRSSKIDVFNSEVTVSHLLSRLYGRHVVPGRTVRCVWHDDRRPSLFVFPSDTRVLCYNPTCWARGERHGQGRDAYDIAQAVGGELNIAIRARGEREAAGDELVRIQADEATLTQLAQDHYVSGLISRAEYVAVRKDLEARISDGRARLARRAGMPLASEAAAAGDPAMAWTRADLHVRRRLLGELIETIQVSPAIRRGAPFEPERVAIIWRL